MPPQDLRPEILVTFAVGEELKPFKKRIPQLPNCSVFVTGMGARNAEETFGQALTQHQPRLVITAGFAGGLNPDLKTGQVIHDAEPESGLAGILIAAGSLAARFANANRVVISAREKSGLWTSTGADAVEMESSVIRRVCRERGVPSATVRVISDSASEDLPLDFNQLMTSDMSLSYFALIRTIALSPSTIPRLVRFQRRVQSAAQNLARVLTSAISQYADTQRRIIDEPGLSWMRTSL